ncbi:restriction endonuclease subunit S [Aquiflexum sp. LQ15W]|uniref:restriction endonuclease subunit S n=1 Tax=Cognataquiflexum nitidum TaxID=2922272 RepID=UPI001F131ECD|nr:restriction endonuclease subunit S [Cognataquiflexum nitidum]MCH6199723.1 restriction endonuclease subunit S [Cognataquiflexum nitidum]
MNSNYKPLGKYIRPVIGRNSDLGDLPLMGLSIQKKFIPSIANIVGTDMSTYRIIEKNQFAYGPVTSRNGEKITIALFNDYEKALISQAYLPFEVISADELEPEYLMMWFRRPEFDRYARFKSHGSAREIFDWEEMCNTLLPIPDITKQREIVKEYNVIQNRIALNQQLIQKLEETAQAIYREWFVEFEFPDESGKPYKSNAGEMIWNEELGKEIPKGWEVVSVKDFCKEMKSGGTLSRDNNNYWVSKDIPWLKTGEVCNRVLIQSEEYISHEGCQNSSAKKLPINTVLIAMYGEGKTKGQAGYLRIEATTNQACCAMICENEFHSTLLYYFLRINQFEIANLANGGAQPNLSKEIIENIRIVKPLSNDITKHGLVKFINYSEALEKGNQKLTELKELILSRLATIEWI